MPDPTAAATTTGIAPRREGIGSRPILISHRRFAPAVPLYEGRWTSYASQWHVRDIDVDLKRGWMWMATWGGVLCWIPDLRLCIRHTSEHGLLGNATRSLAVDEKGIIWAGGQQGGLCYLNPGEDTPWQVHEDLKNWTVLRLAPRPGGGVYAALRHVEGRCALGELAPPTYNLLRKQDGLATKEIEALLVDEDQVLWVGNAWGLHRRRANGTFQTIESTPGQVRAMAAVGGVLWVGTDRGVYSFHPTQERFHREEDWPHAKIVSLTVEPETGDKWIVTVQQGGRIVDNAWQPCQSFPGNPINELLSANPDVETRARLPDHLFRKYQTWAGGGGGLYRIGIDEYRPAFALDTEDSLSNAVQCLWADETAVWVGTTRGLHRFDGETWQNYTADAPHLQDVRAILPGRTENWLWVGSWQSGLHRLLDGVYVNDAPQTMPIVATACSGDQTLWAATLDEVYCLEPGNADWQALTPPSRAAMQGKVIQALHAKDDGLWVGTSAGLWRYRTATGFWEALPEQEDLNQLSIQALASDPLTGYLWVGTRTGLYSALDWSRHRECDVRALAFSPEGQLWIGTTMGLEQWPPPGDGAVFAGEPAQRLTSINSGLAADTVTALALRASGDRRVVWIGSPAGVSCYRYSP